MAAGMPIMATREKTRARRVRCFMSGLTRHPAAG
jgi:hypothetical protein